jgi:hypothetical protein
MGLFDDVFCEADLPAGHPPSERSFQTKSIFNALEQLTITKGGRIMLVATAAQDQPKVWDGLPFVTRTRERDIDLEFHGDVILVTTFETQFIKYVARFTHGTLEWIRPWSELSEVHRSILNG